MRKRQRAPRWFFPILGGGILVYLGFIVLPMVHCHYYGKEAVAVVTNFTTRREGGVRSLPHQVKYCTLAFDGHVVQKRTGGLLEIGERMPVIYLDGDPDSVVAGSRADGLWRTIEGSTNERILMIAAGFAVLCLLSAIKRPRPKTTKNVSHDAIIN